MTAVYIALAAACLGALAGWFALPWVSNVLLIRVCRRSDVWWGESLRGYEEFKRKHVGVEPDRRAKGYEGALGIWREDAAAAALSGSLTEERLWAMREAGFNVKGLPSAGTDEDRLRRFSFRAGTEQRLICSAALGVSFSAAAIFSPNVGVAAMLCVCLGAMAASVVCDIRARTIPLEVCAVLLLAGGLLQLFAAGWEGVLKGILVAMTVAVVSMSVNYLARPRFPRGAIGCGDVRCMGALAVATGAGAVCGFAACYAFAGFAAAVGCATKRIAWTDGVPMAPFLAVWLVIGMAVVLMSS
ncbi:MAG: prepilin peptidase [Gordonibacter sp.]|nr:prepilin peptidase [Gordonibacter sp.]